jgi:hypothetical protein
MVQDHPHIKHKSLEMTMVYASIADWTVPDLVDTP